MTRHTQSLQILLPEWQHLYASRPFSLSGWTHSIGSAGLFRGSSEGQSQGTKPGHVRTIDSHQTVSSHCPLMHRPTQIRFVAHTKREDYQRSELLEVIR